MVSWRAESLTTGTFPIEARKAKAFDRFCTGPEKPESRDGCVSRDAQLTAAKSPTPDFEEKCGNCPDISKGISQSGIYRFESSEVSQALRQFTTRGSQARKSGLFAHSTWSPGARSRNLRREMAESLRPFPEKLPFCRDYWRRPVRVCAGFPGPILENWESIASTAARSLSVAG
jgi:hypothetical protein